MEVTLKTAKMCNNRTGFYYEVLVAEEMILIKSSNPYPRLGVKGLYPDMRVGANYIRSIVWWISSVKCNC
jgi:hypothetical protein